MPNQCITDPIFSQAARVNSLSEALRLPTVGLMAAAGRASRPIHVVMRALCGASVAGLLCLWLSTSTISFDGQASSQPGVATAVSHSGSLSARQHVDPAMIVPSPVRMALGGSMLMGVPIVVLVVALRLPVNRHTPRAPPVALVT
jgi:hypothetical protein